MTEEATSTLNETMPTTAIRWSKEGKLQQLWKIMKRDKLHPEVASIIIAMEWRDVPSEEGSES